MYICNKCGNRIEFEEVNVMKTYIKQNEVGDDISDGSFDEFDYRENVICLKCESTFEDGDVVEL